MPTFTCVDCGRPFTLADEVLARYPGWTPKQCLSCRSGKSAGSKAKSKSRPRRAVEENLTVAEVLEKYTGGPQDGVFTDGSAQPNPGPGGWGAVYVVAGEVVDQAYGGEEHTTNNRMELTALIAGIDLVPAGVATTVYSDSRLVVDTVTKWAAGWERRGWTRKTGPVENLELVKAAYERVKARPDLRVEWIAAHAGNRWNEYADALASAYRRAEL